MNSNFVRIKWVAAAAALLLAAGGIAAGATLDSLTVCADPGNMPLSNNLGQGFENKIAQVIGKALGVGVNYYWRPSVHRGLMRTTLGAGHCILWMDMAMGTQGATMLRPLYRSTYVFVYRKDRGIHITSFDDPILKKLRVGVFQVSEMREALLDHDVVNNTVVHYITHNADLVPANQPSYQIHQVIDGKLDIAAVWGPMAGYFRTKLHAPIVIQPANLLENDVPLEFDLTFAVPMGREDLKKTLEQVLVAHQSEIRRILQDYGVPLVKCAACIISGDLPSHGPYHPVNRPVITAREIAAIKRKRMAELKRWLAHGASPDRELQDAVTADDGARVGYLLKVGAHVEARDGDGYTPLINAARFGFLDIARSLIAHKADVNQRDADGWTALLYAAYAGDPRMIKLLLASGAQIDVKGGDGLTPLAVAAQYDKMRALATLVAAGADVNTPVAKGGYTPLMLASVAGSPDLVTALLRHGAQVNAANAGGVTALMIAAAGKDPQLAQILLRAGADVNARSADGRTPLSIARQSGNTAVLDVLESARAGDGATSG
ncbi:MAG TPA: quinoprotein dehydrogenase-associated putative ABC transporter substrate-binding protein [Steroidobacteraceae bacterium]|nr:quinoprotein dehydrogenase-associated putative ABC transporter substrate-binding protein [Steroidobacteraceae bacterium]HVC02662.1 quinoprotein dehydrogenase-associated putative ABC transporter substrate-binding protein [Steroidobacteraceae bacterium]